MLYIFTLFLLLSCAASHTADNADNKVLTWIRKPSVSVSRPDSSDDEGVDIERTDSAEIVAVNFQNPNNIGAPLIRHNARPVHLTQNGPQWRI